jgi:hypothetical protein
VATDKARILLLNTRSGVWELADVIVVPGIRAGLEDEILVYEDPGQLKRILPNL